MEDVYRRSGEAHPRNNPDVRAGEQAGEFTATANSAAIAELQERVNSMADIIATLTSQTRMRPNGCAVWKSGQPGSL